MTNEDFRLIDVIDDLCAGRDAFFRFVRVVNDIMTRNVLTQTLENTLEETLQFMKDNNVRHAPIVDPPAEDEEGAKPRFLGVVSERDVFRQISPYLGKGAEKDDDGKALQKRISEIITRQPKTVSPETPLRQALETMIDARVDMLPVLIEKELVGIVTAGDVTQLFVRFDALRQLGVKRGKTTRLVDLSSGRPGDAGALLSSVLRTVDDIMTHDVVCLESGSSLSEAIQVMQKGRFRHLPVVDKEGKFMGIVSDRDILLRLPLTSGQTRQDDEEFRGRLFSADSKDPSLRQSLGEAMKRDAVHVSPGHGVYDAAKKLFESRIGCLPVVDEDQNVQGIVTVTDLMRALVAAYELADRIPDPKVRRDVQSQQRAKDVPTTEEEAQPTNPSLAGQ